MQPTNVLPPHLLACASAFPAVRVDRDETLAALAGMFPDAQRAEIAAWIERSGVRTRSIVMSPEETLRPRDFTQRNALYAEFAPPLALRAAQAALERAGCAANEIDVLIDVSCTGVLLPALDARIAAPLGLRPDVRRIPILQAGCGGGALGLGLGAELARNGARVLLVCVELCSLTLAPEHRSPTDRVAALLFGDGAAAAVLANRPGPLAFRGARTLLVPDSTAMMGFDTGTSGLRLVLDRSLPVRLEAALGPEVRSFLAQHGLAPGELALHLVHPGGRRILESYARRFELAPGALRHSERCLEQHGNISSVSLLRVFELALAENHAAGPWLAVGVGPGLSLELSLWQHERPLRAP